MACSCKNKHKTALDIPALTKPDEPCIYCAEKHFSTAYALAKECGYESPNRQAMIGELVAAQWHTYREHRMICAKLRDLRHLIQNRKESQTSDTWTEIAIDFDNLIAANIPCDLFIPLGSGSVANNEELRYCLRSMAKNAKNLGKIWIVSDCAPDWLRNVEIIKFPDRHQHNKDANLIDKFLEVCKRPDSSDRILQVSDDNVALKEFNVRTLPVISSESGPDHFRNKTGTWYNRMAHTFEYLSSRGINHGRNYDSHVPQPHRKEDVLRVLQGVDYQTPPGFCINTILLSLAYPEGVPGFQPWGKWKITCEREDSVPSKLPEDKVFLGYNNNGWPKLQPLLAEEFPEKCKYEA